MRLIVFKFKKLLSPFNRRQHLVCKKKTLLYYVPAHRKTYEQKPEYICDKLRCFAGVRKLNCHCAKDIKRIFITNGCQYIYVEFRYFLGANQRLLCEKNQRLITYLKSNSESKYQGKPMKENYISPFPVLHQIHFPLWKQ